MVLTIFMALTTLTTPGDDLNNAIKMVFDFLATLEPTPQFFPSITLAPSLANAIKFWLKYQSSNPYFPTNFS